MTMASVPNAAETLENFNRLSRAHERYRQTDGRTIAYSEHELEFTFAKNRTLQLPTTLQHHCPTRILPYNHINIRIHAHTTPTHTDLYSNDEARIWLIFWIYIVGRLSIHLRGPGCEEVGNLTLQCPTTSQLLSLIHI